MMAAAQATCCLRKKLSTGDVNVVGSYLRCTEQLNPEDAMIES